MGATGRGLLKRVLLEGTGWLLVGVGIAALVLPGPGLLAIFAGMLLLSQQYDWAERRLEPVRLRALRAAAQSVETVPKIVGSCLGALGIAAFGVLWIIDPAAPSWWPVRDSWWLVGGLWTGVTLIASSLIALAMVVYSFRRFRGDPAERAELEDDIAAASRTAPG